MTVTYVAHSLQVSDPALLRIRQASFGVKLKMQIAGTKVFALSPSNRLLYFSLPDQSLSFPPLSTFPPDQTAAGPAAAAVLAFARRLAATSPSGVALLVGSGGVQATGGVACPSAAVEDQNDEMLVMESGEPTAAAAEEDEKEEELLVGGSAAERRAVHRLCDRLGLSHSSVGHGDARRVVVRRGTPVTSSASLQRRPPPPCSTELCNDISESGAKRQKGAANNSDTQVVLAHFHTFAFDREGQI